MATVSVRIDGDFARFGNRSYAIDKINSVEVRERKLHGEFGALLFGALAVIWLVFAVGANSGPVFFTLLALAALTGIGAAWAWMNRREVDYQLFLMTSSSQSQAFVSKDRCEVEALRDSLEQAIAKR